jgi:electron transport complex protein RnfD
MNPPTHAPHIHSPSHIGQIMNSVMLALVPATLLGFWLYGWPAVNLWLVCVLAALVTEALSLYLRGLTIRSTLMDGSAMLTAWLLALSLPPWAPWWIAIIGAIFAVLVGKQVFGGLGQNVFNPAMIARVVLLISFPVEMTTWIGPIPLGSEHAPSFLESLAITFSGGTSFDAVTSASLLGHVKAEFNRGIELQAALTGYFTPYQSIWGWHSGSLGETSAVLLLLGGIGLIVKRIITWHIPIAMLLGVLLPATLMHALNPDHYLGFGPHLLHGGLILGAFFIATDPVTSPNTTIGQWIFGCGCGLLTYIIRTWGNYPEGVAFAVLIMNATTPVIDHYFRPRIYGRNRKGEALLP